jgi:hypothetical protein
MFRKSKRCAGRSPPAVDRVPGLMRASISVKLMGSRNQYDGVAMRISNPMLPDPDAIALGDR